MNQGLGCSETDEEVLVDLLALQSNNERGGLQMADLKVPSHPCAREGFYAFQSGRHGNLELENFRANLELENFRANLEL